jgi:hypothetical protein
MKSFHFYSLSLILLQFVQVFCRVLEGIHSPAELYDARQAKLWYISLYRLMIFVQKYCNVLQEFKKIFSVVVMPCNFSQHSNLYSLA